MKNKFKLAAAVVMVIGFAASSALAAVQPVQLALVDPIQIFSADTSITGLRLNLIYGRNANVKGLDLGLIGVADSSFSGVQYNSLANITKGNFSGCQIGFVNYAVNAKGLQLGFINYAESLNGLQIGLVNIIDRGGVLPVMPFINWSF